jgi:hypothetical protein
LRALKARYWDKGILPLDTLDMLAGVVVTSGEVDRSATLDWETLRQGRHAQFQLRGDCACNKFQHHWCGCVHQALLCNPICLAGSPSSTTYLVRDPANGGPPWDDA